MKKDPLVAYLRCPVADEDGCVSRSFSTASFKYNPIVYNGKSMICQVHQNGDNCKLNAINKLSPSEIEKYLRDKKGLKHIIEHGQDEE